MGKVLLVDGDASVRGTLASALFQDQHEVREVSGVEEARRSFTDDDYDVVFTNQILVDGGGLALVEAARKADLVISFVLLTIPGTVQFALESMRQGVFDFLIKPYQPEVVRASARRACERTLLRRENKLLKETIARFDGTGTQRDDLGQLVPSALPPSFDLTALLERAERELIVRMLLAAGGTQAEAARRMGLSRSALAYKLNKYGIRASNQASAAEV
ncbi:MAG: response regulator [Acidobacteriia bacterium]|nr:response regulator [Terriglobia bacterium]